MNDYIRIDVVSTGELDRYLREGWEIVETAKFTNAYPDGQVDIRLEYHVGLPARVQVDKLMAIIRGYEEQGLKKKLYEGVAESFGEIASDYETGGGHRTSSKIAKYMEKYEKIVNDQNVTVYKKHTQEEMDEIGRAEEKFNF